MHACIDWGRVDRPWTRPMQTPLAVRLLLCAEETGPSLTFEFSHCSYNFRPGGHLLHGWYRRRTKLRQTPE